MDSKTFKEALEVLCKSEEYRFAPMPKYNDISFPQYFAYAKSYIRELEEKIAEYEDLLDIMNNRKWRKKFNKEIWEKELGHKLSTPDFDFVYMLFFEQRKELKKLKGE